MKQKKNFTVKVTAILALSAIVISVIWTGLLFIYEIYFSESPQVQDLTPEERGALLEELQIQADSDWGPQETSSPDILDDWVSEPEEIALPDEN